MSRDPLELFAPEPAKPSLGLGGILVGFLLALAVIWGIQRWQDSGGGGDKDDQHHEQPIPKTEGKTLVFIGERNPLAIEHDLLLREMPAYCKAHKLQFRAFDDDLEDAPIPALKTYAATKGVQPPLVVLTGQDDKPRAVISWPAQQAGLEELFK